jgi:hypothetical protein
MDFKLFECWADGNKAFKTYVTGRNVAVTLMWVLKSQMRGVFDKSEEQKEQIKSCNNLLLACISSFIHLQTLYLHYSFVHNATTLFLGFFTFYNMFRPQ